MVTEFEVGTWGWDYDEWQKVFYPEDLPEAWRLGYYANEYRVGVIPTEYWRQPRSANVQDWANELAAPFRLFLQMPAPVAPNQLRGLPLEGILLDSSALDFAAQEWSVPILQQRPGNKMFTLWSDPNTHFIVGRRRLQGDLNPAELRALLEAFVHCSASAKRAYLLVDSVPPNVGLVERLGVLANLL